MSSIMVDDRPVKDGLLTKVVLGTAGLGGAWGPVNKSDAVETILYGLEQGIAQLDTAPAYMDAEEFIGGALKQWKGPLPFISTKIGKRRGLAEQTGLTEYGIEQLRISVFRSLERMNLQRIDLLYLHEPELIPEKKIGQILELLGYFRMEGLVGRVGLGGRPPEFLLSYIKEGYFDAVMDFNGFNLIERKAAQADFPFYRKHGLQIYEGSPLMMGLLGAGFETYVENRPAWLSPSHIQRAKEMKALAERNGMGLSSLAHRFLIGHPSIDQMVVGASELKHLKSTIEDCKQGLLSHHLQEMIEMAINSKVR